MHAKLLKGKSKSFINSFGSSYQKNSPESQYSTFSLLQRDITKTTITNMSEQDDFVSNIAHGFKVYFANQENLF